MLVGGGREEEEDRVEKVHKKVGINRQDFLVPYRVWMSSVRDCR